MAEPGKFKCSRCDRSFKMAAHLARHMNTIHAARARAKPARRKTVKRVTKRRARRRKAARRAARRPVAGAAASIISQLQGYRRRLADERKALSSRIAAIDRALALLR